MDIDAIAGEFALSGVAELRALHRRLQAMQRDGQLVLNRSGGFGLTAKMDLVRGSVQGHRDGYGFLVPDDGGDHIYLPPRQMRTLMHGDRAVVRPASLDRFGRIAGAVVEVLERNTEQVVGRFWRESGVASVRPDNSRLHHDVLIPAGGDAGAKHGQMVVAEIVEPPTKHSQPIGRVVEVLGEHMAPGMEVDVAIRAYGLPSEWPAPVLAEAQAFGSELSPDAVADRWDLRETPLVTIDGDDARDFDDALYCESTEHGWRLLVAIADVAHYVRPGSGLDEQALRRGTSVYFPGRVLPMLPETLSNGLCSLNPGEDRLCVVCEMRIDGEGRITRSRFREAVMRSHARLTYDRVAEAIVGRECEARRRLGPLLAHLETLYRLYRVLKRVRDRRGALELDSTETRIVFGANGRVEAIEPRDRNDAHRIIEECMIAANISAARFLSRHRLPALYRVHDGPTADKLADLRAFLAAIGLRLPGGENPKPRHYASLIERSASRPDVRLIQTVLLRSLAQAVYAPDNRGHFGLALAAYAHFTSPIRRYPDLLVHRAIKHVLASERERFPYAMSAMAGLGEQTSSAERRADEATRDVEHRLKCEFMQERLGEEFDGVVNGVAPFGLFVTLEAVFVDGLVHVSALGADYFHHDPVHHQLVGERTGRAYKLADRLRVRVARVDVDEHKLDLEPTDVARGAPRSRRRGSGYRRGGRRGGPR